MDLEVDLLTQETLQGELNTYLDNDYLNIVHMISLDYIDTYDKNELVQQELKQADMVLPGEKAILSAHHVEVLETGGMIVDYHSLLDLAEPVGLENRTFYLVVRNEKEAKILYRYMARHFSKENILGVFTANSEMTEESLINDINTKLPDVILLSMDSTNQEEWLENNKNKLNAKLCMVMGSIMPIIMRENVHVPVWIRKIHLDGIYRMAARLPYSLFLRRRIFNRKMDDYITKKKLRG
jgi:N-acetylglucosaminyldiphosphoundecaprenol N-acetyl-beta-D-mannosaminyltransferase